MDKPKYPRGSEWRKWDLQVHTPFSALNNGFGSDFDTYVKTLLIQAVEKQIAVIGVTDYFSIEGYKRLKELIGDKTRLEMLVGTDVAAKAQAILLLPDIEFRTSVIISRPNGQSSRVNFHVIFSDEIAPAIIEEHFLRELKFTAESNPNSEDERWSLTLANLEALGKKLKEQHKNFQEKGDLYIGMMNAVVAHEDVTKVLERQSSRFKNRFLTIVPADEDLSECSWDGQAHLTRKLYIQKSHMLFSSNPGTREFGLGKRHPSVEEFISEFRSLKPCIHGSDSHTYDSLFEVAESRYTWIKADPTFQGLHQLLNEPEDRAFIGTIPPSIERVSSRPTRVIDDLRISKVRGSSLSEKWFNCSLSLNPELVAIIGNKGNGKSALADILGLIGNTPRYKSFSFLIDDRFRDPKNNNKAKHFEASLSWIDKTCEGPITLDRNPDMETVEKIRYIPQNYLEEICNEVGLGKNSRFYSELQQVIFSHVPVSERLGFDTLDELLEHRGEEINKAIDILMAELKDLNKQIVAYEDRLSLQYKRNLESQLAERYRELQAHEQTKPKEVKKPDIDQTIQQQSKEDSEALEQKQGILRTLESDIRTLRENDALLAKKHTTAEKLIEKLKNLKRQVDNILHDATTDLGELGLKADQIVLLEVNSSPIEAITEEVKRKRIAISKQLNPDEKDSLLHRQFAITREIEELKNKLTAPQREYQSYLQKLKEWEATKEGIVGYPQVVGSIAHLESLQKELVELPTALMHLSQMRDRKALEIYIEKQRLRKYYEIYYGSVQEFLSKHPLTAGERFKVTFNVAIVQAGFSEAFLSKINQRKTGSFAGIEEGAAELKRLLDTTNWNSPCSVLRFTRKLLNKLKEYGDRTLEIKDQLKQGEPHDIYDLIFSFDYLSPIYRLTWEGKGLEQLSPGERGNLLLIFYLLVDRDDIPLVIDQPEENLDNQTVVRTLVPCMKDAKKRRQIVMVTHNPNLAVVCDAEQVIYAEIHKDRDNEVTYVSGSIEDTVINKKIVDVLEGTRPAFDKRDSKYLP